MEENFMVIRSVNLSMLKFQKGVSLIELMIASTIGIIALMAVGSVFLSGQKLALERSQRLLVLQSINDALRYIKEDAQRAGYSNNSGQSFILSGASSVIETTPTSLAYGYQVGLSGATPLYTQLTFYFDQVNEELDFCKQLTSAVQVLATCSPYNMNIGPFSLLDNNRLKVHSFTVDRNALGSAVSSAFITLSITASLLDDSHQQTMSTQIKQRNWK